MVSFATAASVYLLTMSRPPPSDCSERIVASYKLENSHPPVRQYSSCCWVISLPSLLVVIYSGLMVNIMSALAANLPFCSCFGHYPSFEKLLETRWRTTRSNSCNPGCRSNRCTGLYFTDSGSSPLKQRHMLPPQCSGFCFLAILKWENVANEPHSNRWLILIAYIMGLSGVHLLNLWPSRYCFCLLL